MRGTPYSSSRWPGTYYLQPVDLDEIENPLLLHPYVDEPRNHLRFSYAGVESHLTEKGKQSIEVYNLKHGRLRQDRQRAQERAFNQFFATYLAHSGTAQAKKDAAWKAAEGFVNGKEEYSAAGWDWIQENLRILGIGS